MTLMLRDQENIEKGRQQGLQQGRQEGIEGTVYVLKNLHTSPEVIRQQLIKTYGLSDEELKQYLQ